MVRHPGDHSSKPLESSNSVSITLLCSIVFKTDFKYDGAQVTNSNIGRRERAVRPERKRHRRSLWKGGNYPPINERTRGAEE
jgi:hypothetical protein